jgi:hypothetical protein
VDLYCVFISNCRVLTEKAVFVCPWTWLSQSLPTLMTDSELCKVDFIIKSAHDDTSVDEVSFSRYSKRSGRVRTGLRAPGSEKEVKNLSK